MTDPIRIDLDARPVIDALAELVRRVEQPRAAFALIGEALDLVQDQLRRAMEKLG